MADENPAGDHLDLTEAVKSRILDRLLSVLAAETHVGMRSPGYTRSDSGLYGKYEKADLDLDSARMLELIQAEVERAVAEAHDTFEGPPQAGGQ